LYRQGDIEVSEWTLTGREARVKSTQGHILMRRRNTFGCCTRIVLRVL